VAGERQAAAGKGEKGDREDTGRVQIKNTAEPVYPLWGGGRILIGERGKASGEKYPEHQRIKS